MYNGRENRDVLIMPIVQCLMRSTNISIESQSVYAITKVVNDSDIYASHNSSECQDHPENNSKYRKYQTSVLASQCKIEYMPNYAT